MSLFMKRLRFIKPNASHFYSNSRIFTTVQYPPYDSNLVTINVGGTKYQTTRDTINKYPESKLAKALKDGDTNNTEMFLDRNGRFFDYILEFMRLDTISLMPLKDEQFVKRLLIAAKYYNIEPLIEYINLCDFDSYIMSFAEKQKIIQKFFQDQGKNVSKIEMIQHQDDDLLNINQYNLSLNEQILIVATFTTQNVVALFGEIGESESWTSGNAYIPSIGYVLRGKRHKSLKSEVKIIDEKKKWNNFNRCLEESTALQLYSDMQISRHIVESEIFKVHFVSD